MPCYHPLKGWRSRIVNASGKRSIVFNRNSGFSDLPVEVPCGQCIGCRLERSRQWAIRCVHEAQLHQSNCFITLTYNDDNLPSAGSLCLRDFQLFMKRLRKKYGEGIRFFHCGEYGEKLGRPHYHACLFNFDFPDKVLYKTNNGFRLYNSESLQELWPYGFAVIGDVTFESAAYVARYVLKKITGKKAETEDPATGLRPYEVVDPDGVIQVRQAEYVTMSRRPGIGSGWFEKYKSDVFPSDFIVMNGKKVGVPKFYDRCMELEDPESFGKIKNKRKYQASLRADDNTSLRLEVKEKCAQARLSMLPRPIEQEM